MPDDLILQWGSPALYEQARPVVVFDDLLVAQARRLTRTLEAADGAGLAATQVGSLRRMFAFRLSYEHEFEVLVNPQIVRRSRERELFTEGCLSFNSVAVTVRRPAAVRVVGFDPGGEEREFACEDFAASLRVCRGSSSRSCSAASTSVVVSVRNRRQKLVGSERLASGGYYELALPTPGRYFITTAFDHRTQTRPLSIRRGRTKTIDFVLGRQ